MVSTLYLIFKKILPEGLALPRSSDLGDKAGCAAGTAGARTQHSGVPLGWEGGFQVDFQDMSTRRCSVCLGGLWLVTAWRTLGSLLMS